TIRVTKIPISSHCRAVAQALGVDPLLWALGGGEDFELLFAVEAQVVNSLCACIKTQLGIDVVEIGEVTRGKGVEVVKADGCALRLPQTGWDQFTRT
ncbi:MAG: thiamine-phosphate kinase, partial [Candidatus Zipacnadales bacterium]